MLRLTVVSFLFLFFPNQLLAQSVQLRQGIKFSSNSKVKTGTYRLTPSSGDTVPILIIEGSDITIDFNQATLQGSGDLQHPDTYKGIAVEVRNGRNITIRNLNVRGYKIALLARNVEGLLIENSDFSYNYRPRLLSTQQKEDISDWLSYHHNENDEWMRYGAGLYLVNCNKARIQRCKITANQNALLMRNCNDAIIASNDFSFNSGLGIGMYRCSRNNILYNRLVFNIRGYSHGVYQRGQDSAGILVFEQCNNNLFYKNNVTHGGDGFFLWAGQTTMDTGDGGCNDNFLLSNDFSYAATNGIEFTFSRNRISGNRIFECEHGIWGGYSYHTVINGNRFRNNKIGIAIEHGQDNTISYNLFDRDRQAIRLWANASQPSDWGYALKRDTKSRNYSIISNSFNRNNTALNLASTSALHIFSNTFSGCETIYKTDEAVSIDSTMYYGLLEEVEKDSIAIIPEVTATDPFAGTAAWAGRKNIRMTEWGPYNFNYPFVWHKNPTDTSGWMEFEVLGPKGNWAVKNNTGLDSISVLKGSIPGSIRARKIESAGGEEDIHLQLEFKGTAFTNEFGEKIGAGKKQLFQFRRFFQPFDWEVLWYTLDTAYYNPLKEPGLFAPTVRMAPVKTEKVKELDYKWWGGLKLEDRTLTQFMMIASTQVSRGGELELLVTWQGAVRVYIDGKLVLDAWRLENGGGDSAFSRRFKSQLNEGQHIRIEYLGFSQFTALGLKFVPAN